MVHPLLQNQFLHELLKAAAPWLVIFAAKLIADGARLLDHSSTLTYQPTDASALSHLQIMHILRKINEPRAHAY